MLIEKSAKALFASPHWSYGGLVEREREVEKKIGGIFILIADFEN